MGIKEQLDAAGYDTSSLDESAIMSQLDKAGYDTSSLSPSQPKDNSSVLSSIEAVTKNPAFAENPVIGGPIRLREAMGKATESGANLIEKGLIDKGTHPDIAAAVGKAFKLLPSGLDLMIAGPVGETAVEGAKVAGTAIAESGIGKAIRYTGEKEGARLAEKMAELPLKQAAKKELVSTAMKEAGSDIGKAEKALNISQSSTSASLRKFTVKTSEKATAFADRAGRLAEKGSDKLAEVASPETLQFYRKTAEDALGKWGSSLSNEARNKLYQVKQIFGEAIGKTPEGAKAGFGEAMGRVKELGKLLKELPDTAIKERRQIKLAIVQAQNLAKEQARTRMKAGAGAVAAGVALGGRKAINLLTGGH